MARTVRVTRVCHTSATREGAFRWVENPRVDAEAVGRASHEATARRCEGRFVYVAVDQSSLSVTDHGHQKGLGRTRMHSANPQRGWQVMSALAVSADRQTLGLLGQSWWIRSEGRSPSYSQDRRPWEKRESSAWNRTIDQVQDVLSEDPANPRPWYQLDRGGDAWHVIHHAVEHDLWLTVRSAYNRHLDGTARRLWEDVGRQRVQGRTAVFLPKHAARRAGHRSERGRQLSLRFAQVTLQLTDFDRQRHPTVVYAVEARETRPPSGCPRLHWRLLTTVPVRTARDARRVVEGYSQRWKIEEFHQTWKSSGCRVERSQLRSPDALRRWATVLAAVATRIERLKRKSRAEPNLPASSELSRDEIDAAILLSETKKHRLGDDLTLQQAVTLIAQVGGYTGKSSGGPPGSQTLGRGLHDVQIAAFVMASKRKAKT